MIVEVREFWLLLGAASFFSISTVALCVVVAYLLKG